MHTLLVIVTAWSCASVVAIACLALKRRRLADPLQKAKCDNAILDIVVFMLVGVAVLCYADNVRLEALNGAYKREIKKLRQQSRPPAAPRGAKPEGMTTL